MMLQLGIIQFYLHVPLLLLLFFCLKKIGLNKNNNFKSWINVNFFWSKFQDFDKWYKWLVDVDVDVDGTKEPTCGIKIVLTIQILIFGGGYVKVSESLYTGVII